MADEPAAATITITIQQAANGNLTSRHEMAGIDSITGAVILMDVARDILLAHVQDHQHPAPTAEAPEKPS